MDKEYTKSTIELLQRHLELNNGFAKHEAIRALNIISQQQAEIEQLTEHIQDIADSVKDKMTYMCGCKNCIEKVQSIIKDEIKPTDSQCDKCGRCKERENETIKKFADMAVNKLAENYTSEYCHWIDDTIDEVKNNLIGELYET
jgi:translation initiation factor 2B subunit (eIF-2B alpha/beta/delta family)